MSLRLCLFWVKIIFGNAFLEMRLFGWSEKFYFPEIEIRWQKKKAFDHGNQLPLLFSLQRISGKREREREHARARGEDQSELQSASISLAPVQRPRSTLCEIAPSIAISRSVDRDLAFVRSHRIEIAINDAISRSVVPNFTFFSIKF